MSDSLEACTVAPVEGVDITQLPLAPAEGFVLSRIERRVAVAEVAALTGLPHAQLAQTLLKLAQLGALRIYDANGALRQPVAPTSGSSSRPKRKSSSSSRYRAVGGSRRPMMAESAISSSPRPISSHAPPRERSTTPPPSARPASSRAAPSREPVRSSGEVPRPEPSRVPDAPSSPTPSAPSSGAAPRAQKPSYDPKLLEEAGDLPLERRKQVLELEQRLGTSTHYEILGVAQSASRKEIRAAYFSLSKAFHPDTMFRRELGSYKSRMEIVFKGITEAYDVLSRKKARADYDAYLQATQQTRSSERRLRESVELEALVTEQAAAPTETAAEPAVPQRSVPSDRARELKRQAVAARIGRTIAAVRVSAPPPGGTPPPSDPADVDERRRSLAESLRRSSAGGSVDHLVRKAQTAEQSGDIGQAQEHLRRAISIAPGRGDLQEEHTRLSGQLAEQLASDYAQQAELEEKNGKWQAAALSWSKVFAGRPAEAHAARRAAEAMVRAGGDMRRAHHFARQAVLLEPKGVDNRITLGRIMLQLGLAKGARRELQAALGLDPNNEMVKNLLAELQG